MDPGLVTSEDATSEAALVAEQPPAVPLAAGDQTGYFTAVCDELKVGELIDGDNFSLFEAMSAREIMDPKMDAGVNTTGYKTVEEAIEKGAACIVVPSCIVLVVQLIKTMCTNPAWQRRKLRRVILEWGMLLEQAETARESFIQSSAGGGARDDLVIGWAAEQRCWIVSHCLMLGFELELYSLNEYCVVYGLTRKTSLCLLLSSSAKKKGKKKKGGLLKMPANKEIRVTPGVLLIQCYSDLAKGFVWMLAVVTGDRKIIHRETIFNSELERFMQRFELLHRIVVPEPMTYLDFRQATSHKRLTIKEVYQVAYDHFMAVQQHVQELAQAVAKASKMELVRKAQRTGEVRQLEQVAPRNRVALQIAHQAGPGDNLRVYFQFSQHPCFAVAVVKKP